MKHVLLLFDWPIMLILYYTIHFLIHILLVSVTFPKMSVVKRISERVLDHLKRTYVPSDFKHKFIYKNIWGRKRYMHPKVSLRKLADMRKNAEYLRINTESIGLPPKKEKRPPRTKPPKGAK